LSVRCSGTPGSLLSHIRRSECGSLRRRARARPASRCRGAVVRAVRALVVKEVVFMRRATSLPWFWVLAFAFAPDCYCNRNAEPCTRRGARPDQPVVRSRFLRAVHGRRDYSKKGQNQGGFWVVVLHLNTDIEGAARQPSKNGGGCCQFDNKLFTFL